MGSRTWRVAETLIPKIAAEYGALAQVVTEDESGWDLQIEFPSEPDPLYPDKNPKLPSAYVQIKSTSSAHARCRVTLSNLLRMARSQEPWFVILYQQRPNVEPILYVRHIWSDEIYHILKKVRQAHHLDQKLNSSYIQFNFANPFPVDTSIMQHIHQTLIHFGEDYMFQKTRISRTVGYDDGYALANVKIQATDAVAFKKNFTGYGDGLEFEEFAMYDSRFGFVGETPDLKFESGKLRIEPEPIPGFVILFIGEASRDTVSFNAEAYVFPLHSEDDNSLFFRLSSSPLELFYQSGGNGELKFDLDTSKYYSLSQIVNFAKLNEIISQENCDVQIWKDGKRLIGAHFTENIQLWGWDWHLFYNVTELFLRSMSKGQYDQAIVKFHDIFNVQRDLIIFYQACKAQTFTIEFEGMHEATDPSEDNPRPTCCLYHFSILLSNFRFNCLVQRSIVNAKRSAGVIRMELGQPTIIFRYADDPGASDDEGRSTIRQDYDRKLKKLSETEHVLDLGDLRHAIAYEE